MTRTFEVVKIGEWQKSHNGDTLEKMVCLRDEKTQQSYISWICQNYRNYNRSKGGWRKIREGQRIWFGNLRFKGPGLIDADSAPMILQKTLRPEINLSNPKLLAEYCL